VDLGLGLGVEAGAGLVKDHQIPALPDEGPGEREPLPLPPDRTTPVAGSYLSVPRRKIRVRAVAYPRGEGLSESNR